MVILWLIFSLLMLPPGLWVGAVVLRTIEVNGGNPTQYDSVIRLWRTVTFAEIGAGIAVLVWATFQQ